MVVVVVVVVVFQRATAEVFDHLSETAAEPLLAGFADLEAWCVARAVQATCARS